MRERPTARVVLLDPDGRILLMKGRLPSDPGGPSFWFTIGGGVEPGESLAEAAQREILEETGLSDANLLGTAWFREVIMAAADGEPWLFQEHYVVAHTQGGALSRAGWLPHEARLTDDMRWWSLEELRETSEIVFPEMLAELLPDVMAGRLPPAPLTLPPADSRLRR